MMAPNVHVVAFALPVSAAELRLFTEAAKRAAADGAMPNRSRWLTDVALTVEPLAQDRAEAMADVAGNRRPIQVTMPPDARKRLKPRAKELQFTSVAALMRAAALARARELGLR